MQLKLFTFFALWGFVVSFSMAGPSDLLFERGSGEFLSAQKLPKGYPQSRALKNAASTLKRFIEEYPNHEKTAEARYDLGSIYSFLAQTDGDKESASTSLHYFKEVVSRHSASTFADDALWEIAQLCSEVFKDSACAQDAISRIRTEYSNGNVVARLEEPSLSPELTRIELDRGLDVWKITLIGGRPSAVEGKPLSPMAEKSLPGRFFVDLQGVSSSPTLVNPSFSKGDPITQIRFGQHGNTVRVVVDLASNVSPSSVSMLSGVKGLEIRVPVPTQLQTLADSSPGVSSSPPISPPIPELSKVLPTPNLGRKRIILDAGHGGDDTGARGRKGTFEKDVCLAIARRLKDMMKERGDYEVFMTRTDDRYITLSDRTQFANEHNGDLFVSIHANAAPRKSAEGVSTYFLDNHDDAESLRVAMRENNEPFLSADPVQQNSDSRYLEIMKASMEKNFHTVQSTEFARKVQTTLLKELRSNFSGVQDLGVRSARFYVLTGATMPAILVETSFISNPKEEKRLTDPRYQQSIAKAVAKGIDEFFMSSIARGDHAALFQ